MQPPLNDAQRRFLLVQRLAIVWKVVVIATALVVVFVVLGGHV